MARPLRNPEEGFKMPRFTASQHVLAVAAVLVISLAFHGLFELGETSGTARASASSFSAGNSVLLLPLSAR